jgi:hypothetical protein
MEWNDATTVFPPDDIHIVYGLVKVFRLGGFSTILLPLSRFDDQWYSHHFDTPDNDMKPYKIKNVVKWCLQEDING